MSVRVTTTPSVQSLATGTPLVPRVTATTSLFHQSLVTAKVLEALLRAIVLIAALTHLLSDQATLSRQASVPNCSRYLSRDHKRQQPQCTVPGSSRSHRAQT